MIGFLFGFWLDLAFAKRNLPAFVHPVRHGSKVYLAKVEVGGKGFAGVLAAEDAKDNHRIWTTEVYRGVFDPDLERDAQEVHFVRLEIIRNKILRARDERGRVYEVRLSDGKAP